MKKPPKLILCGSIALDRIMDFNGQYQKLIQPDKIHILSLSVLIDNLNITQGGVGANIAYSSALLGEKPILVGSLGNDALNYRDKLHNLGIDTSHIYVSHLPTASFSVFTDLDHNQVGGFYPGAMLDSQTSDLSQWQTQDPFVVISPHDPKAMRLQIDQCQTYNYRLFYDIGQQANSIPLEDLQKGLEVAELVIVNDFEVTTICSRLNISETELKLKTPVFITTKGHEGSVIEGNSVPKPIRVPAVKTSKVVDPTGAGDAYRAGFLYGYLQDQDLQICAQIGSVTASFAIEKHGTQEHFFTREEFNDRYYKTYKTKITF